MRKEKTYKWTEYCTSIYFIILFLAFPLYFQNNYINMLEAKTSLFTWATCIYLVIGAVSIVLVRLSGDTEVKPQLSGKRLMPQDIFFLIFLAAVIISTLLSQNIRNAWTAPDCKMFGTMIILLCCGIYCLVSRGYILNKAVKISFSAGMAAVFILTVLNRYGIDPLGMYDNLVVTQKDIYLSTIGNVNVLSNFICIFIPLLMGVFIYGTGKTAGIISGVLVYLGVMAGVATNSDSFFLGFAAGAVFLLWHAMSDIDKLTKYVGVCIICTVAVISLNLFNQLSAYSYTWENLQLTVLYRIPCFMILIVLAVLLAAIRKISLENHLKKIRNIIFILLGIGLLACITYVVRVNAAIIRCVKTGSAQTLILAAVFVSWLAQGTVNNPLVFTTPYLFLFLGMSRYEVSVNKLSTKK